MDVDAELVARAREGDDRAMNELLAAVQPAVLRRCSRMLPFRADAEEATQDALLAIATHLPDYTGRGSFAGWVTVIASNAARQTYRSMRRRFSERTVGEVPDGADPRRTSVIAGSRLDLLDAVEALENTHPASVQAFVLRDIGALPYSEVAALLAAPIGTVKAQVHTARQFVRERLDPRAGNS